MGGHPARCFCFLNSNPAAPLLAGYSFCLHISQTLLQIAVLAPATESIEEPTHAFDYEEVPAMGTRLFGTFGIVARFAVAHCMTGAECFTNETSRVSGLKHVQQ